MTRCSGVPMPTSRPTAVRSTGRRDSRSCRARARYVLIAASDTTRRGCTPGELDLESSLETMVRRAEQAVLAAAELNVDAIAPSELLAFGDSMPVTIAISNRGRDAVQV